MHNYHRNVGTGHSNQTLVDKKNAATGQLKGPQISKKNKHLMINGVVFLQTPTNQALKT